MPVGQNALQSYLEGLILARKKFDPLALIPPPEAIRERLAETETLAQRLRILLDLSERLQEPVTTADQQGGDRE
jgi:hypothetical protein